MRQVWDAPARGHESVWHFKKSEPLVSIVTKALEEAQRTSSLERRPGPPGQYWLRLQAPKVCLSTPNTRVTPAGVCLDTLGRHGRDPGALYVSDNCTLEGTEKLFSGVFKPFFDEFVTFEMLARHASDAVLEMSNRLGCRQYSRVHDVESGAHSRVSPPSPSPTTSRQSATVIWHGNTLCEAKDANSDVAMQKASERCFQIPMEKPKLLGDVCNCLATQQQPAGGTKSGQRRK